MHDRKSLGIFSDEQRAVLLLLLSVHSIFLQSGSKCCLKCLWGPVKLKTSSYNEGDSVQTKTLVPVISVRSYVTLDLSVTLVKVYKLKTCPSYICEGYVTLDSL